MSIALERLAELHKIRDDANREIEDKGKDLFKEAAADIFANHPTLEYFSWTQCTPYFNDGDECTFSAHTDYFHVKIQDEKEEKDFSDYELYDHGRVNGKYVRTAKAEETMSPATKAGRSIQELLQQFEDEDFKLIFGDHKKIIVSKDGVDAQDYDHD
jgi:hypothetical protein